MKISLEFILSGEVVSKKNNNRYNPYTGRVYKKAGFVAWHNKAMAELASQKWQLESMKDKLVSLPLEKVHNITFDLYHASAQRRDADNQITSVLDLLVEAKIIKDDNAKVVKSFEAHNLTSDEEKCVITIECEQG